MRAEGLKESRGTEGEPRIELIMDGAAVLLAPDGGGEQAVLGSQRQATS